MQVQLGDMAVLGILRRVCPKKTGLGKDSEETERRRTKGKPDWVYLYVYIMWPLEGIPLQRCNRVTSTTAGTHQSHEEHRTWALASNTSILQRKHGNAFGCIYMACGTLARDKRVQ